MSTQVFTLDDLNVERAIGLDSFGLVFQGTERSSTNEVIILGIVPPPGQTLTTMKLQQSLRGVLNINHRHIAPVIAHGLLSEEQANALHDIASHHVNQTIDQTILLPQAYIAYHVHGAHPLKDVIEHFDEATRIKIVQDLLAGLGSLHSNRINHLALSPQALWWTEEGLVITHSGVAPLMKKGLSLSRDQSDPDPHIMARLPYVSPEELAGKLTHQSCDLYTVSVIMHEWLIGPLISPELNLQDMMNAIQTGLASRISDQLSTPWQILLKKGLGLTVRERFTSVNRFQKTLEDCLQYSVSDVIKEEDQAGGIKRIVEDTQELHEEDVSTALDSTLNEQSSLLSEESTSIGQDFQEQVSAVTLENDLGAITEALQEIETREAQEDGSPNQDVAITHNSLIPSQPTPVSGDKSIFDTMKDLTPVSDEMVPPDSSLEQNINPPNPQEQPDFMANQEGNQQESIQHIQAQTEIQTGDEQQPMSSDMAHTSEQFVATSDQPLSLGHDGEGVTDELLGDRPQQPVEVAVQSLRSKMSQKTSSSMINSERESHESTPATDDVGDLAFGVADSDMAFGFSQDDAGERTFLEFSDIDEQTLFEEDLDAAVQASHKTMMGLPAAQNVEVPEHAGASSSTQSTKTAVGMPYQAVNDIPNFNVVQPDLQTPDFLSDYQSDIEPSRVLPIPSSTQLNQGPKPISIPNASLDQKSGPDAISSASTPVGYAPSYIADPSSFPQEAVPAIPLEQSHPAAQSSLMAAAHDWPVNEMETYKPPTQDANVIKGRQAPRLRGRRSLSSRITSWFILTVMILGGGVGIYWASSHWDQIAVILSVESAESINISTTPSNMSVRIDQNSPLSTPAIFTYDGQHAVGDELRLKFMWKPEKIRKRRKKRQRRKRKKRFTIVNVKTQVLAGNSNLYFIGGKSGDEYSQSLVISQAESLQVTLQDPSLGQTPLGQTPLIIIGPKNRKLSLQISGSSINKERKITLGQPQDAELIIESDSQSSSQ